MYRSESNKSSLIEQPLHYNSLGECFVTLPTLIPLPHTNTYTPRNTQSHQTKEDLITKPRISPLNIIGILSHTPPFPFPQITMIRLLFMKSKNSSFFFFYTHQKEVLTRLSVTKLEQACVKSNSRRKQLAATMLKKISLIYFYSWKVQAAW